MNFLSGYKTYLCALGGGLVVAAYFLQWIDAATAQVLLGLFGFGGLASLRAAL